MNGRDLSPDLLLAGYREGLFPMTVDEEANEVHWFRPHKRTLLPIEGIHVSRSLAKTIRRATFEIRFDTDFEQVMRSCFRPEDNWLSEDFVRAYTGAHRQGWGHSSECWKDGKLVGGVYGLALGACFCAESMFHDESNASKVALWALVERVRELGFTMVDAQLMTSHLKSLGAYTIGDRQYMRRLREGLKIPTEWSLCVSLRD